MKFTLDTPSSHQEEMCPVLNLQISIDTVGLIMLKFYGSKIVIPEKSAYRKNMMMSVLDIFF